MQDPNPLPWGALDRYQAHFIVRMQPYDNVIDYVTKTKLSTKGHFSSKKLLKITWDGTGKLARMLNQDDSLNDLIVKQSIDDATIYIEPTDNAIRIRSKWKNHLDFGITSELFEIYDKIAGHIKKV
ncbi:MAG: hypothetical protein ITD33_04085 [Nitrosarchaeum sp.]|nr:hypothetical protein [Nitrosarchaeum sp.]MBP0120020.1 hypothetical protein [Nitrosarchaeum sp.]MBP0134487.1 hypothetical protein [Nitrosarchaeum sp.]MDW7641659.1 hypothetical protein [Nitrosarchaeum sp.]MSV26499.1 hypothetical protein [Nitrosarchaeum sp.]